MKKDLIKEGILIFFVLLFLTFIFYGIPTKAASKRYTNEELKTAIEALYNHRSTAFITGDLAILEDDFDTSRKQGVWAREHEIMRVKYLHDWASARGIKFTNVTSSIRFKKVFTSSSPLKIALEETYKFEYIYPRDAEPVTNTFGVGIRHTLGLSQKEDRFLVAYDWYTDCFEDALKAYNPEIVQIDLNREPQFTLNCRPRGIGIEKRQESEKQIKDLNNQIKEIKKGP